jgi:hypothetical protein
MWETKLFTLYADPITVNCRKVMAGLEFLGVDFERVRVDFFAGEHKEPGSIQMHRFLSYRTAISSYGSRMQFSNLPPTSMNVRKPTPKTL